MALHNKDSDKIVSVLKYMSFYLPLCCIIMNRQAYLIFPYSHQTAQGRSPALCHRRMI